MNKSLKISIIVLSSLIVAGGITLLLIKRKRKKVEKEIIIQKELDNIKELDEIRDGLDSQDEIPSSNYINPTRNLDKGISNNFRDIKGKMLYPAIKSTNPVKGHIYAQGFANIRETPEVNNKRAWYDPITNYLGKVNSGTKIGTIVSEQYDNMTPKMRWFKVKLAKKIDGEQYGWVRSDNVTFYGFKKNTSSSFDGNFVEKYDNSYMLGSEVFPHPNWMIGYSQYSDDVMNNFEGLNLDLNLSNNSNYLSSNFFSENRPFDDIINELLDKDLIGVRNVFRSLKIKMNYPRQSGGGYLEYFKKMLKLKINRIFKRKTYPKKSKKFKEEINKLILKNNIKTSM